MTKEQLLAGLRRFAKGFVAGGVASLVAFLASGTPITEFEQVRNLAIPACMAFLTGGLLAIQKMVSWKE